MNVLIALLQGTYFFVTGVWPLISRSTFMKITGPKADIWLVKTVGCILAVIGGTLIFAYARGEVNAPVVFLAIGSAAVLALIEFIYVIKRVISPVYLLDVFAEIIIIAWWIIAINTWARHCKSFRAKRSRSNLHPMKGIASTPLSRDDGKMNDCLTI